MQSDNCCYCERGITDWGTGKQVEHYRPKACFQHLKYDWDNLLLACGECNYAKRSKFPKDDDGEPLILNPYDPNHDPEDHIDFFVRETKDISEDMLAWIVTKNNSQKGIKTIEILRLDTTQHIKSRKETLDKLRFLYMLLLDQLDLLKSGAGSKRKEWSFLGTNSVKRHAKINPTKVWFGLLA